MCLSHPSIRDLTHTWKCLETVNNYPESAQAQLWCHCVFCNYLHLRSCVLAHWGCLVALIMLPSSGKQWNNNRGKIPLFPQDPCSTPSLFLCLSFVSPFCCLSSAKTQPGTLRLRLLILFVVLLSIFVKCSFFSSLRWQILALPNV